MHVNGMPEELNSEKVEINVNARMKLLEKLTEVETAIENAKKFHAEAAPSERDTDVLMGLWNEKARLEENITRLSGDGE